MSCVCLIGMELCYGQLYTNYSVKDGLPSNCVYGALEDDDGFLWLYTDNGVAKFDGYSFQTFDRNSGLENDDIWLIHRDVENLLWLVSSTSMGYFIENDSVKKVPGRFPTEVNPNELYFLSNGLLINQSDSSYIISKGGVVSIPAKGPDRMAKLSLISNRRLLSILEECMDCDHRKLPLPGPMKRNENGYQWGGVSETIWIDQYGETLKHKTKGGTKTIQLPGKSTKRIATPNMVNKQIVIERNEYSLTYDLESSSFIDSLIQIIPNSRKTRSHFNSDYWVICTRERGIFLGPHFQKGTHHYKNLPTIHIGESHVLGLHNRFYQENNTGELEEIELPINSLEGFMTLKEKNLHKIKNQWNLFALNKIVSIDKRSILYDFSADILISIDSQAIEDSDLFNSVHDICFSDSLLLVAKQGDLIKVNIGKRHHQILSFPHHSVRSIEKWKSGFIIGTNKGIYVLSENHLVAADGFDGLCKEHISNIIALDETNFICTTPQSKIFHYNEEELFEIADLESPIVQIEVDSSWIRGITSRCFFRIDMKNNIGVVEKFNFLSVFGLDQVSCFLAVNDSIYMGSQNGVYTFSESDLQVDRRPLELNYFDAYHNGQRMRDGDAIVLEEESIKLNYAAISLVSMGSISYEYQLSPRDSVWKETKQRELAFSWIAPGHYTIKLRALDGSGRKSANKQFSFVIVPPWYKRWIFYFGVLFISMGSLIGLYMSRLKKLKLELSRKALMNRRFADLKLEALRSQMNPHFIFNTLSSIQNTIRGNESDLADRQLTTFAALIRSFLDLSTKTQISLHEEINMLEMYIAAEKMRFGDSLEVGFEIQDSLDLYAINIPTMIIQPFVENAISHGLFNKLGKKNLEIRFFEEEDVLRIEVEDNGIGRTEAAMIKSKSSFPTKSKGIRLVEDRIEVINDIKGLKLKYKIVDLTDKTGKSSGTIVHIEMDLK